MSGTRSVSPRGPATEARAALLVAHGSPSRPDHADQAIRALAARIGDALPGWAIRGATLAAPGALEAALTALADRPGLLVFPFFMSDGWFVRERLPRRIQAVRSGPCELLRPLGLDPALHRICLDHARETAVADGLSCEATGLLLAAHGSPTDPGPRRAAEEAAGFIASTRTFREVKVGFIDEAPYLAQSALLAPPAVCLPFFAGRAGHVDIDLPAALADASYRGLLLDPIGLHPRVETVVASALLASAERRAA